MKEASPGLSGSSLNMNKFGDTAHFPGTGPAGASCGKCVHFNTSGFKNVTTKRGRCVRVATMRDISVKHVRSIYASTLACKYYLGDENV